MDYQDTPLMRLIRQMEKDVGNMSRTDLLATLALIIKKLSETPPSTILSVVDKFVLPILYIVQKRHSNKLARIYNKRKMFKIDLECFILLQLISFSELLKTLSSEMASNLIEIVSKLAYEHKAIHFLTNNQYMKEDFISYTAYLVKALENRGSAPHLEIRDSPIFGKVQNIFSNINSLKENPACALCKNILSTEQDIAVLPNCKHFICETCAFETFFYSRVQDPVCPTCSVEIGQWTFWTILRIEKENDFKNINKFKTRPDDIRPVIEGYWQDTWQRIKHRKSNIPPLIYINLALHILSDGLPEKLEDLFYVLKLLAATATCILEGLIKHKCTGVEVILADHLVDEISKRRDYCAKWNIFTEIMFQAKQIKAFYDMLRNNKSS